jgi:hypothetical protein
MRNPLPQVLAAAVLLAAAVPAAADTSPNSGWSVTATLWGGVSNYDVMGVKSAADGLSGQDGQDLLDGKFDVKGAAAVVRLGWLDLGVLYEGTRIESKADSAVLTPVAGVALNLTDLLRLDLLGELGGHKVSNIGVQNGLDVSDAKSVWLPYVGVRPTLSLRVPVGPTRVIFQVAPFARWDLNKKEITVTGPGGTASSQTTYEIGGSTFGIVGGIGLEI